MDLDEGKASARSSQGDGDPHQALDLAELPCTQGAWSLQGPDSQSADRLVETADRQVQDGGFIGGAHGTSRMSRMGSSRAIVHLLI
jgi:hypothetical protein